ncbi:MAG: hypothetical protein IK031_00520 [Bacteroidales bacterium]|nr:hypothetical protein [Bacteroidales bacterium]
MTDMTKLQYTPPEADFSLFACSEMLAGSGFNNDNSTEYIDEEYGGLI